MDNEIRFIACLLRASKATQEKFYAQSIPKGVFRLREQEINWVYRFRQQHGAYPSAKAYLAKFHEKLPKVADPLPACLQPVLDIAMFNQMNELTKAVKDKLDRGEPTESALALFKQGASRLTSFSVNYVDHDFALNHSSIQRYRQMVRDLQLGNVKLITSPWPSLNKLIGFLRPGNTAVLAARPSIGKTWITISWADYVASEGIETLYFTKEMTTEEISDRTEALRFKLPHSKIIRGELLPSELGRWHKCRASFKRDHAQHPLVISGDETTEGAGFEHVASKIEQYKPEFVVVDGAYLLSVKGLSKNANRTEKYAEISSQCKVLAKNLNTTILIVIQMNRRSEKPDGTTKGSISDLYGSDSWAQDADFVFDVGGKRGSNMRTINILKGRNSAIGEFNVKFQIDPYPNFDESGLIGKPTAQSSTGVTFTAL